ncbi:MAG: hypothetical protein FWE61_04985 [Micrococcales bacterium]|nr:hypothetical protein [Micrococcales bacterium]
MTAITRRPLLAVLTAVALAGCTANSGAEPSPTVHTASPLAPYLSLLALDADAQAQITRHANDLIAACMKDQGFTYDQPYVPDRPVLGSDDMDPVQWASVHGYAIATGELVVPAPEAVHRSAAEQVAYDAALYGTGTGDGVAYDWRQEGCMGSAYHEATGGADEIMADERYAALFAAIDAVTTQVGESGEVAALNDDWSQCMAGTNHPGFVSPQAAQASAEQALGAVLAEQPDPSDLERLLRTVSRDEIALAVADATCQRTVDYPARYDQLLWTAQTALVVDYRDDLEALALAQG